MRYVILKTLIVLFACMFSINAEAFTISKTITGNNLGLVGHWTFDGKDLSPNVRDISGKGNHGYLTNFTSTSTLIGKIGQALDFDGSDDRIVVPESDTHDFGAGDFSFSVWVNGDTITDGDVIFSKTNGGGASSAYGFHFATFSSGKPTLHFASGNTDLTQIQANTALTNNAWYHVTVVVDRDSSSNTKFYINGAEDTTSVTNLSTNTGSIANSVPLTIGTESDFDNGFWDGKIDDIRMYNRLLSKEEVKQLYAQGASTKVAVTNGKSMRGLVAHWTFDGKDMPSGRVNDTTGNGNGGSMVSMATTTAYTLGKIGQGLYFDGSNDRIRVERNSSLEAVQGMTVTGWIKRDGAQAEYASIINKTYSDGDDSPYVQFNIEFNSTSDTDLQFCVGHSNSTLSCLPTGTNTIPDKAWVFFAGVHDRGSNTIKLYTGVDNGQISSVSSSASDSDLIVDTTDNLQIGSFLQGSGQERFFKGTIDDIRYFNRALTATEIGHLYNSALGFGAFASSQAPEEEPDLPSFAAAHEVDDNAGVGGAAAGDLDGDGDVEYVSIAPDASPDDHFRIWEWNGTGFTAHNVLTAVEVVAKQDRFGGDIDVADVDGDGLKDIITSDSANSGNTGELLWYENPGSLNGTWTEHVVDSWGGGGGADSVRHAETAAGDLDGDGAVDLAIRGTTGGVWIYIQASPFDGSTWNSAKYIAVNPREGLTFWNPDGDSDQDVLINGVWIETPADPVNGTYTLRVIEGAEAWYPSGTTSNDIAHFASKVVAHDFNGDGKQDFIITNAEELTGTDATSSTKPEGISVYFNPADTINDTWIEVGITGSNYSWHNAVLADADADGDMDLFSGISDVGNDTTPGKTVVWINGGDGETWTEHIIASNRTYQLSVGDMDEDGDQDVFAPENFASGEIWFYQRQ